jgi:cytochrome c oxidase subunit 2
MNAVPGMITLIHFKPIITTAEMRKKLKNDKFDYYILCNKICGTSHYAMKMLVVIDTPEEYAKWLGEQKEFMPKASAAVTADGGMKTAEPKKEEPKGM